MRSVITILLCTVTATNAQRITREYNNVSLAEALRELNTEATAYEINFLYNELEDFRITTAVSRKSVPDAIRQMIGFYPIRMTVEKHEIYVECLQKAKRHLTGTIIDENSQPVPYANVCLFHPSATRLAFSSFHTISLLCWCEFHLLATKLSIAYATWNRWEPFRCTLKH